MRADGVGLVRTVCSRTDSSSCPSLPVRLTARKPEVAILICIRSPLDECVYHDLESSFDRTIPTDPCSVVIPELRVALRSGASTTMKRRQLLRNCVEVAAEPRSPTAILFSREPDC